jgi:hypothetical protein
MLQVQVTATKRFMIMFHQKLLHLGPEKVTKHITLADLTKDEMDYYQKWMQRQSNEQGAINNVSPSPHSNHTVKPATVSQSEWLY